MSNLHIKRPILIATRASKTYYKLLSLETTDQERDTSLSENFFFVRQEMESCLHQAIGSLSSNRAFIYHRQLYLIEKNPTIENVHFRIVMGI